jgi:hypothetical protein
MTERLGSIIGLDSNPDECLMRLFGKDDVESLTG